MKKSKKIALIFLVIAVAAAIGFGIYSAVTTVDFGEIVIDGIPEKKQDTTRVMSFNVRCISDPEGSVKNRSKIVTAIIEQYLPDSFGVQEATGRWLGIIDRGLGDKYDRVGEARDNRGYFSEYSCVYYLKDKYNLLDSGTIWLSETPDVPNTGSFDTACKRIATWAVLEDKQTGKKYTHLNTHLDHVLESTRVGQAGVLIEKLQELQKEGTVICTGDFNTHADGEVYAEMIKYTDDTMVTARSSDSGITFHAYGTRDENGTAIDFIFASKGTEVENYKIIRNKVKDMYPSDHYPLIADVYIR